MESLNDRLARLLPRNLSRDLEKLYNFDASVTVNPGKDGSVFNLKAAQMSKNEEPEVILHVENEVVARMLIPLKEVSEMEAADDFTLGLMLTKYLQGGMRALRRAKTSLIGGTLTVHNASGQVLLDKSEVAAVEMRLHYTDKENSLSHNIADRVQTAEQMLQMNLIKTPEQYFQVINTGKLEATTDFINGKVQNEEKTEES